MAKAPAKGSTQVEDATTLLMEDHRKVRRMFDEFKKLKSGDVEEKEDLVRKACAELKIHTTLEEEIFYPAAREKLDDASLIDEAEVEHASDQIERLFRCDDGFSRESARPDEEALRMHVDLFRCSGRMRPAWSSMMSVTAPAVDEIEAFR